MDWALHLATCFTGVATAGYSYSNYSLGYSPDRRVPGSERVQYEIENRLFVASQQVSQLCFFGCRFVGTFGRVTVTVTIS